MAQHIIVVEYNPQWIHAFEKEAVLVRNILGENCIAVYHIGSTAVPGLAAKPIIDIMPVVRNIDRHLAVRDYLRTHKDACDAYAGLKQSLAEKYPYDIDGYCDGKDGFMKRLEEKALSWVRR